MHAQETDDKQNINAERFPLLSANKIQERSRKMVDYVTAGFVLHGGAGGLGFSVCRWTQGQKLCDLLTKAEKKRVLIKSKIPL